MRYIAAIALLLAFLPAMASDGYVGWSKVSFSAGPWSVRIAVSSDGSRISTLSINAAGVPINLPAEAISAPGHPLLNDVKLLHICCSDHVVLQIPMLEFDATGHSSKRIWEVHISGGSFQGAAFRNAPNPAGES